MGTDDATGTNATALPTTIGYDLIKSNHFRVIFADGVFGGVSPAGMINVAFFNERFPIPRHIEHHVQPNGQLGKEISRDARTAIVREVEAEVILTIDGARLLRDWLAKHIVILEEVQKEAQGHRHGDAQ